MDIDLASVISRWFDDGMDVYLGRMLEAVFCLGTAVACGTVVGYERRADKKAAGIRTHVLVCTGAAAFVHLGVVAVDTGTINDFGRLIQSIATGIGFLGAGAIFRGDGGVSGITTATSIWVMGAIGVAAGAGAIGFAVLMTLITYLVLQWSGDVPVLDDYLGRHEKTPGGSEPPPN
jgi:putative Mg2+ transporter-C (MgtC) family protein